MYKLQLHQLNLFLNFLNALAIGSIGFAFGGELDDFGLRIAFVITGLGLHAYAVTALRADEE